MDNGYIINYPSCITSNTIYKIILEYLYITNKLNSVK